MKINESKCDFKFLNLSPVHLRTSKLIYNFTLKKNKKLNKIVYKKEL